MNAMFLTVAAFAENATTAIGAVNATNATSATSTISALSANSALSVAHNATESVTMGTTASVTPMPPVAFSWFGYFEAIGVMLLLLVALWGLLWLARRYGKFRFLPAPSDFPSNGLRIEAQLPLGPRRGLYVIRYLDERLLIGVTEQQISLLQDSTYTGGTFSGSKVGPADAQHFASLMEHEQATQHENDSCTSQKAPLSAPVSEVDRHAK